VNNRISTTRKAATSEEENDADRVVNIKAVAAALAREKIRTNNHREMFASFFHGDPRDLLFTELIKLIDAAEPRVHVVPVGIAWIPQQDAASASSRSQIRVRELNVKAFDHTVTRVASQD